MKNRLNNAAIIDVSKFDQNDEDFDAFIESIPNGSTPLSAMLDQIELRSDDEWDKLDVGSVNVY